MNKESMYIKYLAFYRSSSGNMYESKFYINSKKFNNVFGFQNLVAVKFPESTNSEDGKPLCFIKNCIKFSGVDGEKSLIKEMKNSHIVYFNYNDKTIESYE